MLAGRASLRGQMRALSDQVAALRREQAGVRDLVRAEVAATRGELDPLVGHAVRVLRLLVEAGVVTQEQVNAATAGDGA